MKLVKTNLIFPSFDAVSFHPFIFIRPNHETNKPLIVHETIHLNEQKEMGVFKWWFKYLFNKQWRLEAEIRAYKAQIAAGFSINSAAYYLQQYGVDLTFEQAVALLKE